MKKQKQLWLLSGGNGAGKTTFYKTQLQPHGIPFVNADILAKQLYPEQPEQHSYEAAKIAEEIRINLLKEGRTFCFETVFSHPSKIDFVAQAKTYGYEVVLVFIHLTTVNLNMARISQRVSEGGHNVPDEKVIKRIPRTLKNVRDVIPLCDHIYLMDNSSYKLPYQQILEIHNGVISPSKNPLPEWAENMINNQ